MLNKYVQWGSAFSTICIYLYMDMVYVMCVQNGGYMYINKGVVTHLDKHTSYIAVLIQYKVGGGID